MARMGQEKLFEFPQVRGDVGAEAADPKSRALETDASGLNRRHHGAWGSSRGFIVGCSVSAVLRSLGREKVGWSGAPQPTNENAPDLARLRCEFVYNKRTVEADRSQHR